MPAWISGTFEWLVNFNMHPAVTFVVFLIVIVSRVMFEEPHVAAAKEAILNAAKAAADQAQKYLDIKSQEGHEADRISRVTLAIAFMVSLLGQFALYWPRTGQGRALCAFFSVYHVGFAMIAVYIIDKYGLIDRFGRYLQKKADEKTGIPTP
jgi:hypothetical protein